MDLIAELARRERIALRMAIRDALDPDSDPSSRLSLRSESHDAGHVKPIDG
jgi:hypothetical protein